MGRRGPAPTPTAILKLAGSPVSSRADFPSVPGIPVAPAWLKGRALEVWREAVGVFGSIPGLVTLSDSNTLAAACVAQEMAERYYAAVQTDPDHRTSKVLREWLETSARLWGKFGGSPADRVRQKSDPAPAVKTGLAKFAKSG
jgi:phage terminase small subunit